MEVLDLCYRDALLTHGASPNIKRFKLSYIKGGMHCETMVAHGMPKFDCKLHGICGIKERNGRYNVW